MGASTGARIGSTIGGALGDFAQNAIGSLFGLGEYETALKEETGADEVAHNATPSVNSLVEPLSSNEIVPFMHTNAEGTVTVRRREFVRTLQINTAGFNYDLFITPTASTFPWLEKISKSWQQWSVTGLAFEYVPTSGLAVGAESAALGAVSMAFKYNVDEQSSTSPIHSLTQLLNQNGATSHSPGAVGCCYMECDPTQGGASGLNAVRFIATGEVLSSDWSQSDFTAARFIIKTEGAQNASGVECGQLWVTYEITLYQPRVDEVIVTPSSMPSFAKYLALSNRYHRLIAESGPFSDREMIEREAELRRIRNVSSTVEFKDALNRAIYESEIQALEDQLHPEKPEPLGPLEDTPEGKLCGGTFIKTAIPGNPSTFLE
jgi:hypothetical protein